ncbi:MAG: hypothetical protein ACM3TT_09730 [Syntrophothermus sp.]
MSNGIQAPFAAMQQQVPPIVPGPCPPTGCPPPTEIVCIETKKVYDFCVQTRTTTECFEIPRPTPSGCPPTGKTIDRTVPPTCAIATTSCTLVSSTPVPGTFGFVRAVFDVCFRLDITLTFTDGTTCTFTTDERCITKRATIFAPPGTRIICNIINQDCGPCRFSRIVGNTPTEVCCDIALCIEVQSRAKVKLLVPSFGFCVPSECVEFGGIECPPVPLFPPQLPVGG